VIVTTFPEKKYATAQAFAEDYFERYARASKSLDLSKLAEAASLIESTYKAERTLFVCGNGGSAAISGTFVCDHSKLVQTDTTMRARVVSLADNMSMITAIANDLSYDDVFLYQLQTLAGKGDALLCISASGNSENVVRAAEWAGREGLPVISFTGFTGGRLAGVSDLNLHVDADNYGIIEDVHQSLMHLLAQYVRQANMDESLIAERKF